jgi:hypothetical protein
MSDMDRELDLGVGGDLPQGIDARYRDRLLMIDEMEETAEAIRSRAAGFDDVAVEQVQRLEAALRSLREDVARGIGEPPRD